MEAQKEQTIEIPSSNNTEPNMKNIKTMAINVLLFRVCI